MKRVLVTGVAGFIGSNVARCLADEGCEVVGCDWASEEKLGNLRSLSLRELVSPERLPLRWGRLGITHVVHQGAITDTTCDDARKLTKCNLDFSIDLLEASRGLPFIYASSASVYGSGRVGFVEERECESPLNLYAWSKLAFDEHVRQVVPRGHQVFGLRYFNVYGSGEEHKGRMASLAWKTFVDIKLGRETRLFRGDEVFPDGGHRRDFTWVGDVASVVVDLVLNGGEPGIYNCGTGISRTFDDLVAAVAGAMGVAQRVVYVEMPPDLKGKYQCQTVANTTKAQRAGIRVPSTLLDEGVSLSVEEWERMWTGA